MPTNFAVQPIDATFGAVITGVKLATIDVAALAELKKAWLEYGLLVFPGQFLANDEQIAFAKRISPLEFEMSAISNVKPDGTLRLEKDNDDRMKTLKGNMGWHMDSTYMPVQARGAVFSAEEVPTIGGHTGFCDMRAAYDALDAATKAKVEKLRAYHSLHYSQAKAGHDSKKKPDGEYNGYGFHDGPVPLRPLVKVHPETGRKNLVIGRHAHNIPGMGQRRIRALPAGARRLCHDSRSTPRLSPRLEARRRRAVGQSPPDAPRHAVGFHPAPHHVAQPARRRSRERDRAEL